MKNADLAKELGKRLNIDRHYAQYFLEQLAELVKETVLTGREVKIHRFGKFYLKRIKAHTWSRKRPPGARTSLASDRTMIRFVSYKETTDIEMTNRFDEILEHVREITKY